MKKIYVGIMFFIFILFIHIPIFANNELVYIDKENIDTKYHRVTCSEIRPNRYISIPVESAFAQGYRKCSLCEPALSDIEQAEKDKEFNERLQHARELTESIMPTSNETSISTSNDNRTVYVTTNGAKFHSAGCDEMKSTPHSITVANAQNRGYAPCKVCNPYGLAGTTTSENKSNLTNPLVYIIIGLLIVLILYIIFNDNKNYNKKNNL